MNNPIDEIMNLFAERGANAYHGEAVSQKEHALQAAWSAERDGADAELITAALLHDVGHLLYEGDEDAAELGIDDRHEVFGAAWLEKHFGPAVVEPIRMHVDAKRYLCAAEPEYYTKLSEGSIRSLLIQGGPLKGADLEQFQDNPHAEAAVKLRRWDEAAKVVGLKTPSLDHFRRYVEQSRKGR